MEKCDIGLIIETLKKNKLNITKTAKELGISRKTIQRKMSQCPNFTVEIENLRQELNQKNKTKPKSESSHKAKHNYKFNQNEFLRILKKKITIIDTCRELGCSESIYYKQIQKYPEFKKECDFVKAIIKERIGFEVVIRLREELGSNKADGGKSKIADTLMKAMDKLMPSLDFNDDKNESMENIINFGGFNKK